MNIGKTRTGLIVLVLAFIANILIYIASPFGDNFYIVADVTVCILSLSAVVLGVYAYRLHGFKSSHGKTLFFLMMGTLLSLMANILWTFSRIVYDAQAPPIAADVLWFLAYPCFFAGMFLVWKMVSRSVDRRKIMFMAASMAAILCAVVASILPVLNNISVPTLFMAACLVGDMIIVDQLIVVMIYSSGGKLLKVWGFFLLSMATLAFGHIYYMTSFFIHNMRSPGEVFFTLSYLFMGFGFLYNKEMFRTLRFKKGKRSGPHKTVR
jgi:hypothetical protein